MSMRVLMRAFWSSRAAREHSRFFGIDGRVRDASEPSIASLDRAFLYGDGVFTTLRVVAGRPVRLDLHVVRLAAHAEAIHLGTTDLLTRIQVAIDACLKHMPSQDVVVRIMLTRDAPLGLALEHGQGRLSLLVRSAPLASQGSVRLVLLHVGLGRDVLAQVGLKSIAYAPYLHARDEAVRRGADDALLLDPDGAVREATSSNVFVLKDGALWTPPRSLGILAGVTRAIVLGIAHKQGILASERVLFPSDLYAADAVFLTNAVAGLVRVSHLDGRPLPNSEALASVSLLERAYEDVVQARVEVEVPEGFR